MYSNHQDIPQQIKRYSFVKVLGQGGNGKVCLYEQEKQLYAVKLEDSNNGGALKNEQQILKKLNDYQEKNGQNILFPKLYDSGFIKPYNYLIMEYLDQPINTNMRDPSEIKEFTKQCFRAVRLMHRTGYIHRDIKLENFMYKNNQLYLIDFGSASEYIVGDKIVPLDFNKQFVGSKLSASLQSLAGFQNGRIDDYISIINSILLACEDNSPLLFNLDPSQNYLNDSQQRGLVYLKKLQLREDDFKTDYSKRLFRVLKFLEETYFDQYEKKILQDNEIDALIEKIDEPIVKSIHIQSIAQIYSQVKTPLDQRLSDNSYLPRKTVQDAIPQYNAIEFQGLNKQKKVKLSNEQLELILNSSQYKPKALKQSEIQLPCQINHGLRKQHMTKQIAHNIQIMQRTKYVNLKLVQNNLNFNQNTKEINLTKPSNGIICYSQCQIHKKEKPVINQVQQLSEMKSIINLQNEKLVQLEVYKIKANLWDQYQSFLEKRNSNIFDYTIEKEVKRITREKSIATEFGIIQINIDYQSKQSSLSNKVQYQNSNQTQEQQTQFTQTNHQCQENSEDEKQIKAIHYYDSEQKMSDPIDQVAYSNDLPKNPESNSQNFNFDSSALDNNQQNKIYVKSQDSQNRLKLDNVSDELNNFDSQNQSILVSNIEQNQTFDNSDNKDENIVSQMTNQNPFQIMILK
ncbi:ck1 family protein kinase [Stylonychia lemnae]|uniref:Ck1 family protein kinase n=1 Tax=Stylonychia lemnae TaxID=5949 RepID=A0A078A613_STYLE|nr:ck1 family protein kinase [Stylonychia lemnae]|eukprot:CDW77685.1 ck1 family protein kinase [Stylonychia lemnae]